MYFSLQAHSCMSVNKLAANYKVVHIFEETCIQRLYQVTSTAHWAQDFLVITAHPLLT